jgi:hypothetical protein
MHFGEIMLIYNSNSQSSGYFGTNSLPSFTLSGVQQESVAMISRRSFLQQTAGTVAASCIPVTALALGTSYSGTDEPMDWVT